MDLLMNKNGSPKGNKWSFDEENRKKLPSSVKIPNISKLKDTKETVKNQENEKNVSDKEAEEAFKTILRWIGEDPEREGLKETPKRVVKASSASLSETFFSFS